MQTGRRKNEYMRRTSYIHTVPEKKSPISIKKNRKECGASATLKKYTFR